MRCERGHLARREFDELPRGEDYLSGRILDLGQLKWHRTDVFATDSPKARRVTDIRTQLSCPIKHSCMEKW